MEPDCSLIAADARAAVGGKSTSFCHSGGKSPAALATPLRFSASVHCETDVASPYRRICGRSPKIADYAVLNVIRVSS